MLLLIAGIIQLIMSVTVLGFMIALLNAVNESDYCNDHYFDCVTGSDGNKCADSVWGDEKCENNQVCVIFS